MVFLIERKNKERYLATHNILRGGKNLELGDEFSCYDKVMTNQKITILCNKISNLTYFFQGQRPWQRVKSYCHGHLQRWWWAHRLFSEQPYPEIAFGGWGNGIKTNTCASTSSCRVPSKILSLFINGRFWQLHYFLCF